MPATTAQNTAAIVSTLPSALVGSDRSSVADARTLFPVKEAEAVLISRLEHHVAMRPTHAGKNEALGTVVGVEHARLAIDVTVGNARAARLAHTRAARRWNRNPF